MRMNKTVSNLLTVWQQLDNASGDIYNALDTLSSMVDLPDSIKSEIDMIDVTRVDGLKNEVEELIKMKKGGVN